ncbi:MAG: serine hydrolase [Actinobacteria bacterium]|nr:serine hydrolase [Actinomycetota bacterium]
MNDAQRERVDEIFAAYFGQDPPLTPGVAYGVVKDGELVYASGLGTLHVGEQHQPGADSSFRIASMTKSFVAATLLLLRDEGVLRLDDTAEQWVPELQGLPLATGDSRPPTLRQLLSMNSGYPEDDPWADRLESLSDDEYSALMGEPKTFARTSGIAFDYSNIGFTMLGRVIQNATGQPYRAVVTERIIAPLGLCDTTWSEEGVDPTRIATGYALVDGEWIAQPIQSPGAFSALGGLYSTVADLAVWVAGFIDAWPPRDGDDQHPLSRASRREMQQVVTAMPLQLGAGEGLLRAQAHGYCLSLMSAEDLATGRTIGHSGGYPGFGSRMTWHPASRIGVIALANGRYARPGGAVADALAALVADEPRRLHVEPLPALEEIRTTINAALIAGDFAAIEPLLAFNVDLDETLGRRSSQVASLAATHGALTPEADLTVMTPTQVAWWLTGEQGRVGVELMLNPEQPPTVQKLDLTSVLSATPELEGAVAGALEPVKRGTDLSPVLLPIRSAAWIACDGQNTGTVRVVGAHASVQIVIDLNAEQVATFKPEERWPASA